MLVSTRWRRVMLVMLLLFVIFTVTMVGGGWRWAGKLLYPLPYREDIFRFSGQFDLDPYFVAAVIRVESRFYAEAKSKRGAKGLMQLMPETAEWIAGKIDIEYSPELLSEPRYNIRMGCWYLADLLAEFDGNKLLTLAAYNGGRGRVRQWLETGSWDGREESIGSIPFPETQKFVRRVWRDYDIYRLLYGGSREL